METYKITINNGNIEQEFEFRMSIFKSYHWELFLTKTNLNDLEVREVKSPYSIKIIEDNDSTSYDLCKNDEPIKRFEFQIGGFGNIPNLLEVLMYILKVS